MIDFFQDRYAFSSSNLELNELFDMELDVLEDENGGFSVFPRCLVLMESWLVLSVPVVGRVASEIVELADI